MGNKKAIYRLSTSVILAVCLTACCPRRHYTFQSPNALAFEVDEGKHATTESEAHIALIADNQFHNLHGNPDYYESAAIDNAVSSAVHPGASNAMAPLAFEYLLGNQSSLQKADLVLHLGDAMDLGCRNEFTTFLRIMKESRLPWLFIPGNHDGNFFGNIYPKKYSRRWQPSCRTPDTEKPPRFDKNAMIRAYADLRFGSVAYTDEGTFHHARGDLDVNGHGVSYRIYLHKTKPWRSYILQKVELKNTPTTILLLDTNTYRTAPKIRGAVLTCVKVPNFTGELTRRQEDEADEWINGLRENDRLVIAGHHHFKAMKGRRDWIRTRLQGRGVLYLSGHTHSGYHGRYGDVMELNVSSLIGWPLGYRDLYILKNGRGYASHETLMTNPKKFGGLPVRCDTTKPKALEIVARQSRRGIFNQHKDMVTEAIAAFHILHEFGRRLEDPNYSATSFAKNKYKKMGLAALKVEIRDAERRVMGLLESLPPAQRTLIREQAWCQLFWSAKSDIPFLKRKFKKYKIRKHGDSLRILFR